MSNVYDQFDAAISSNPYDQFDAPAPPASDSGWRRATNVGIDVAKGVVGLGESVVGIADLISFGAAGSALSSLGYDPKRTNEILSDLYSGQRKEAERNVEEAEGFVGKSIALFENPSVLAGYVTQAIPGTVGIGAAGIPIADKAYRLGKAGAIAAGLTGEAIEQAGKAAVQAALPRILWGVSAAEGAQQAGSLAEQARQEGKPWAGYVLPAVGSGTTTALIGRAGGALAQKFPKALGGDLEASIATAATGGKLATQTGGLINRAAKGFAREGVIEEMPQSSTEQIWQNVALDRPAMEGAAEQGAVGLFTGGLMGGGHAVLAGRREPPADPVASILAASGPDLTSATDATIAAAQKAADWDLAQAQRQTETSRTFEAEVAAQARDDEIARLLQRANPEQQLPGENRAQHRARLKSLGLLGVVNAAQIESAGTLDVGQQAENGEAVGEGNAQPSQVAGTGQAEVQGPDQLPGSLAPKTVAGEPVAAKSTQELQALVASPETPANTRHAAAAAIQARTASQPAGRSEVALAPAPLQRQAIQVPAVASAAQQVPGAADPAAPIPVVEKSTPIKLIAESRSQPAPIASVETFAGRYGQGMTAVPAAQQQKRLAKERPDLDWRVEPSDNLKYPNVVAGYTRNAVVEPGQAAVVIAETPAPEFRNTPESLPRQIESIIGEMQSLLATEDKAKGFSKLGAVERAKDAIGNLSKGEFIALAKRAGNLSDIQASMVWNAIVGSSDTGTKAHAPAQPSENDRLAAKRAIYQAYAATGAPDDVIASLALKAQDTANERGEPMALWRNPTNGVLGLMPASSKSPFKGGERVATIYPELKPSPKLPAQPREEAKAREAVAPETAAEAPALTPAETAIVEAVVTDAEDQVDAAKPLDEELDRVLGKESRDETETADAAPIGESEVRPEETGAPSGQEAVEAEPVAATAEPGPAEPADVGDRIRFTPTNKHSMVIEGNVIAVEPGTSGQFRYTIRTDLKAPQGGGFIEPQVWSNNGTVEVINKLQGQAKYEAVWDKAIADERASSGGTRGTAAEALTGYWWLFKAATGNGTAAQGVGQFSGFGSKLGVPKTYQDALAVLDEYLADRAVQVAARRREDVRRYEPSRDSESAYRDYANDFEKAAVKAGEGYDVILAAADKLLPDSENATNLRNALEAKQSEFRSIANSYNASADQIVVDEGAAHEAKIKPFDATEKPLQKKVLGLSKSSASWMMARHGSEDWYTNSHLMTNRPPIKNVSDFFGTRHNEERKERADATKITSRLTGKLAGKMTEIKPIAEWAEKDWNAVLFDANGHVTGVNRAYYDLLKKMYPDARFMVGKDYNGESAIGLFAGKNELVGVVMPIRTVIERDVAQVKAIVAESAEAPTVEPATEATPEASAKSVAEMSPSDLLRAAADKMDAAAKPAETHKRQAKPGGEYGANGEWYKGGQFIAESEDTIKGKLKKQFPSTKKQEIGPREWATPPEDGIRSLYTLLGPGVYAIRANDGTLTLNSDSLRVINSMGGDQMTAAEYDDWRVAHQKLIDRYNAGERWIDPANMDRAIPAEAAAPKEAAKAVEQDANFYYVNGLLGMKSDGSFTEEKRHWMTFNRIDAARMDDGNIKPHGATRRGVFIGTVSGNKLKPAAKPITPQVPPVEPAMFSLGDRDQTNIATATRRMGKFVDEFTAGRLKDGNTQILGPTPTVLLALGAQPLHVQIDGATVRKVLSGKHKEFMSPDMLKRAAQSIYDPLMVFDSPERIFGGQDLPGKLLLTETVDRLGNPVVVAIHLTKEAGRLTINDIASVYGLDNAQTRLMSEASKLEYYRNETSLAPSTTPDLDINEKVDLADVVQAARDSGAILKTEADVVKEYGAGFARGQTVAHGITEQTLRSEIAKAFGPRAERMVGDILIPLQTQAEIADRLPDVAKLIREGDRVSGFHDPKTGKTYAILENLSAGEVRGLALHEVGVHFGFEGMLGADRYAQVLRQVDVMRKAGNKAVIEARAQATKQAANPGQVPEETVAYLVSNNPGMGFVRRLIAEIKAFLFRKFGILGDRLTVDDIAVLARASVLHASESVRNGEPQFIRDNISGMNRPSTPSFIQSAIDKVLGEINVTRQTIRGTDVSGVSGLFENGSGHIDVRFTVPGPTLNTQDAAPGVTTVFFESPKDGRIQLGHMSEQRFEMIMLELAHQLGAWDVRRASHDSYKTWSFRNTWASPIRLKANKDKTLRADGMRSASTTLRWPEHPERSDYLYRLGDDKVISANDSRKDDNESKAAAPPSEGRRVYGDGELSVDQSYPSDVRTPKFSRSQDQTQRPEFKNIDDLPRETQDDIAYTLSEKIKAFAGMDEAEIRANLLNMVDPVVVEQKTIAVAGVQMAPGRGISAAAVKSMAKLETAAPPILVDGAKLIEGGHRLQAAIARGDKTIAAVDVGPFLRADWAGWTDGKTNPTSPVRSNINPTNPDIRFQQDAQRTDAPIEETRKVQAAIEGKSVINAALFIANHAPSADYRLIGRHVLAQLRRLERAGMQFSFNVAHIGDKAPPELNGTRGMVWRPYGSDVTQVWLQGTDVTGYVGTSYETVLHELLHAATQTAITVGNMRGAAGTAVARSFAELRNVSTAIVNHFNDRFEAVGRDETKMTPFERSVYLRLNNVAQDDGEVVSWAMTNRPFQEYLEGIPYHGQTLWSKFVAAVRKFLGLAPQSDTALSEVIRVTEDLLNLPAPELLTLANRLGMPTAINRGGGLLNFSRASWIDQQPADTQEALRKAGNRASWDAPEPGKLDTFIRVLQDKHIDSKRVVTAIKNATGALRDATDVYLQEELFHGRAAKAVTEFLDMELRPLFTEMSARKVEMPEFEEYLHARHAGERNEQIARINPEMPDGGSGMDTADARAYLEALTPEKRRAYEALAKRVDAINAKTRQDIIAYGLESPDTIRAWEAAYQNYVPLHREDMEGGPGIGQGYSVRGAASKRATGSKRAVVDILANVAMQRERVVVRGEKNRVSNALVGLAIENPNSDFWKVDKPPILKVVNDRTGLVEERVDPLFKSRENVIVARIRGADGNVVEHAVIFNEHDERAMRMVTALKNLDAQDLEEVLGLSAKITRYFSSINTQYNPVFGVVNLIRDTQGALFNLSTTDIRGKQVDVMKHTISALRGIYIDARAAKSGEQPTSAWSALWEEFQREGGQTGYRDMFRTSKDRSEAIKREIKKVSEGKAKQFGRYVFDWLSDYNNAMENAVRLAAYKVGKENGMTNQRAASMAKNLTVNFNRKGQIGVQAGALYAFFNASVQGTARMLETLNGPSGRKIIAGGFMLGSMQALLLAAAGFDDNEPPEFVRERSLILPIGDKKYLTLPMPLGLHILPNLGRIPTEFVLGGFKHPQKKIASLVNVFVEAFNPIGNAGLSLQTIAPTAIDPIAALAENKDWTGKPIAREDFNKLAPTPGHTRAKDTASVFSKAVSLGLNWISGGTNYKPGIFSPTPDQIDYLIGQVAGGLGREAMKTEQTVTSAITGEEMPTYKIPLLGRFYGSSEGQAQQGSTFYSNLKEINEHEAEIKGRRKAGEPIGDYLIANPEVRLVRYANHVERQVSLLRRQKRELTERGASRDQIKTIDARITQLMRVFNERVRSVTEKEAA